ncbi:uncharacterized protein LOC100571273 isoform X1 [Acyrthosiphon pisum]|uniref:Uncharacterized protein n=2 Tax=Acyrthosiphon pisum TaxID=7029 RepID=A0A8R2F9D9_ACYPI|nr:uncharacterized protein LOC100571273 isoform X1 [Acyrthosiphon pisum]XP_008182463.1 uncharacterized protein LOC100571273 isoform X1 [Acyrthosiphon pisum]XP_016659356.1 uncharacterized protein LOC100571273 isoform X1 [Acyrthosiphon pisum]|eukprot:XP_003244104.2 PREDICTED: uncharacterized protein LOC100571273 [Acyrthosiphon pisum]
MPSKKRKYNARFPAGRIKKIMRIDDEIGKVALPVPVMISRALELFVSSLLIKAGDVTMQKSARTLTLAHLKQCIYSDSRLDFLKELVKSTPDHSEECNDIADSAVIQNNQVSNNDSDEETLSKTIEWHLLNGCACPLTGAEYEWLVTFPTEVNSLPSDTIDHLSTMRLLLSMRRHRRLQHPVTDYCPTVERACSATLSSTLWFDQLLAMLASVDDHVRYVATCVATEAALGCADVHGDSLSHMIDGLLLTITTTVGRSSSAAVNVLTRVLDVTCNYPRISTVETFCFHDGDKAGRFTAVTKGHDTKTLLLDRLNGRWLDVVHATVRENGTTVATDYQNNGLADIIGLWTAVFRLFRFAGSTCRNREQFYSELPSLEWLLYRTDTEPLVWLNTVRLFGASLQRCLDQPIDDWWMAGRVTMAERVLTGFTRRRMLYFMCKMASSYGLENDRTKILLQETVLLAIRSLHAFVGGNNQFLDSDNDRDAAAITMIRDVVDCLDSYVKASTLYATDVGFCRWTVRLMCDRDDATIQCLTCALDVADAVPSAWSLLDPFASFAELLECVSYEPDVLLDYLISEESNFLPYALRILKTACRDARCFFKSCGSGLDDAMVLLIRLRLKMLRLHENHVFPYNVVPIAKLIQRCDELYTEIVL